MAESTIKALLLMLALVFSACGATTNDTASVDASVLPQCSVLGGASGTYCTTLTDGNCEIMVCDCVDQLGHRPYNTTPVPGYDSGCSTAPQCSPLGGANAPYCHLTNHGNCTSMTCDCVDQAGTQVHYDSQCDVDAGN